MKVIFFILLSFPLLALSQSKYALIDKNLKQPILFTDSVSVEQVSQGYFPIENKHVDTLIANLIYLKDMLSKQQRAKMESFELRASNAVITTKRVPYAYGDRYDTDAVSVNGEVTAVLSLVKSSRKNKENSRWIGKLLSYLEKNRSFYKPANEITPRLYNVVVISDK